MIWWATGIVLFVCVFFVILIMRGADAKKRSDYFRKVDDEQQEKVLCRLLHEAEGKKWERV